LFAVFADHRELHDTADRHFRSLDCCPALVLNADYTPLSYLPLSLWPWQDAIKAVWMDRVTVLATYNDRYYTLHTTTTYYVCCI
jgi:hypothetical protein